MSKLKPFLMFVFCFLLVLPHNHVVAQTDGRACDTFNRLKLENAAQVSFHEACQLFQACKSSCEVAQIQKGFHCFSPNHDCELKTRLYTLTLFLFDASSYRSPRDFWFYIDSTRETLLQALVAIETGNYSEALRLYVQFDKGNRLFANILAQTVLYQLMGDTTSALENYRVAIEQYSDVATNYLWRGQLLVDLGQPDLAAFDFMVFQQLTVGTALNPLADSLVETYPLPNAIVQNWLLYPTHSIFRGVVGESIDDRAYIRPRPVELRFYPEQNLVLVAGLSEILQQQEHVFPYLVFVPNYNQGAYDYLANLNNIDGFGDTTRLSLQFTPLAGRVVEDFSMFESGIAYKSILLPPDNPDPRFSPSIARCGNTGAQILFHRGNRIRSDYFNQFFLFSAPNSEDYEIIESYEALILSEAACKGKIAWHEAEINGQRGWIAETHTNTYLSSVLAG